MPGLVCIHWRRSPSSPTLRRERPVPIFCSQAPLGRRATIALPLIARKTTMTMTISTRARWTATGLPLLHRAQRRLLPGQSCRPPPTKASARRGTETGCSAHRRQRRRVALQGGPDRPRYRQRDFRPRLVPAADQSPAQGSSYSGFPGSPGTPSRPPRSSVGTVSPGRCQVTTGKTSRRP